MASVISVLITLLVASDGEPCPSTPSAAERVAVISLISSASILTCRASPAVHFRHIWDDHLIATAGYSVTDDGSHQTMIGIKEKCMESLGFFRMFINFDAYQFFHMLIIVLMPMPQTIIYEGSGK